MRLHLEAFGRMLTFAITDIPDDEEFDDEIEEEDADEDEEVLEVTAEHELAEPSTARHATGFTGNQGRLQ